ncbi:unnamed protein product [Meloidogyne enterolobii]|uniref:Uncharacterized protein n=1 Tax=Meloidogyne enterolobii TaxID=390850 RepID=A0ACB0ZCG8_MELEN
MHVNWKKCSSPVPALRVLLLPRIMKKRMLERRIEKRRKIRTVDGIVDLFGGGMSPKATFIQFILISYYTQVYSSFPRFITPIV